jgi:hypothetical protein
VNDLNPRGELELVERPGQKENGAPSRIEKNKAEVWILDCHHETWQSATRPELQDRALDWFQQDRPQKGFRMGDLL